MGTSLHRRILEDEGFAAIFAASSYSPSPVQRDQKIPSSEIVKQRAQALRNAPASIIVSGSVGPRYGYPIAEALKERKADTRLPALKPGLPNRESRKISNPALAIDGLWIDTSSITQIASLQLAKSLLEHQANQELRFKQNLSTGPLSVIAGGQIFAGYLMMINVTQGSDAQGIGLTSRSILSHLTNAMPTGAHFEDLRAGAIAKLSTQLASPQTATELMVDFRLMGARTPWIEQVIARMHNISSKDLETFLSKHASATHTFSVRWGPNQ